MRPACVNVSGLSTAGHLRGAVRHLQPYEGKALNTASSRSESAAHTEQSDSRYLRRSKRANGSVLRILRTSIHGSPTDITAGRGQNIRVTARLREAGTRGPTCPYQAARTAAHTF